MTYKKGLLLSLISRYFSICSSYQSFHCELQNLKQVFSRNGYPISLIDNCIRSFLNKTLSPKPPVHSCSKKILFFCIPYTGQHGFKYAHNSTDYSHLLTHIYLFALSFVLRADCLTFSIQGPNSFCNEIARCV